MDQEVQQKIQNINFRPRLLFRRTLLFGSSGKDVQLLYQLLNKDRHTHTDPQGSWSSGYVRNHFGNDMERAVKHFQKKYGIFSENDEEYGIVERKTKKKIREVFANDPDYLREFNLLQENPSKRRRPIKVKLERHSSWRKKYAFLSMFEMWGCNILKAAKNAHISNKSFYNWYKTDTEFKAKIDATRRVREKERMYYL